MEGFGDIFSALPRRNSPENKKSGEVQPKPELVQALIASVKDFNQRFPLDKAIDLATKFGKWGETLPEDGSRDEYGALIRDFYAAELSKLFEEREKREAA